MKSNIKNLTIAILISGLSFISNAQTKREIRRMEDHAMKAFSQLKYREALPIYLQLKSVSNDPTAYDYMIGMCLLSTEQKSKAISYLESGKNHESTSFVVNYYLGRAYMIAGNYEKAESYLETYAYELKNYIKKYNLTLRPQPNVPEDVKIHTEKSLDHANGFIAECQALARIQNGTVSASK
ncbi:MAG: hypothetical protein NW207_07030 [Cytophagales bacterium]|nr:hypothetical protein [Cytophagales bacterium]